MLTAQSTNETVTSEVRPIMVEVYISDIQGLYRIQVAYLSLTSLK